MYLPIQKESTNIGNKNFSELLAIAEVLSFHIMLTIALDEQDYRPINNQLQV